MQYNKRIEHNGKNLPCRFIEDEHKLELGGKGKKEKQSDFAAVIKFNKVAEKKMQSESIKRQRADAACVPAWANGGVAMPGKQTSPQARYPRQVGEE